MRQEQAPALLDFLRGMRYNSRGTLVPEEHHMHGGGCFPSFEGSEFLFLPSIYLKGGVIKMYITLVELLMLLSVLIALADFIRRDK